MIKLFGILAILASALMLISEIRKRMNGILLQENEILRFIRHIRKKIECYLSPIGEWCSDFSSDELTSCGIIFEGRIADAAYFKSDRRLLVSDAERQMLFDFFSGVGGGYLQNELERIEKLEEDFRSICENNAKEIPRRVKCYEVIVVSLAVGACILFL